MSRRTAIRAALCTALAAIVAGPVTATAQESRPRIVASFSIVGDIVREIAPQDLEVVALVGPDADAHAFEPRPSDARLVRQADLVIVNGLGFEGWIDRLVVVSGYRGPIVVASRGVTVRYTLHGAADPHAWHDLRQGRIYVRNIADAIVARWPARQSEVAARSAAYLEKLEAADARVRSLLNAIPVERRRVITSHDAFGYFGDAYGVIFLPLQGVSPASEPAAKTVAKLQRQIREQRIHAIFVENIGNSRLLDQVARDSDVRIGGTLYSDALSAGARPAATYLALIEHNAHMLAGALGSNPEAGPTKVNP